VIAASLSAVVGAILACIFSIALCRLLIRIGPLDRAEEAHKAHSTPVPTSGGLGVGLAVLLCAPVMFFMSRLQPGGDLLALSVAAFGAMALGYVDDRRAVPAGRKLVVMLALALGLAAWFELPEAVQVWPGASLSLPRALTAGLVIAWCVTLMNAVNFMDGANGLAMGMACIVSVGLSACAFAAGLPDAGLAAALLAGALAGFLVWNVPGRVFAGDAGSLFVGLFLAGVSVMIVARRPDLALIPPTIMTPFLIDVFGTLAYRASLGRPLMSAHRDHVYQLGLRAGLSHGQVALVHCLAAVNCAGMCVVASLVGGWAPLLVCLGVSAAGAWLHVNVRIRAVRAGFS